MFVFYLLRKRFTKKTDQKENFKADVNIVSQWQAESKI